MVMVDKRWSNGGDRGESGDGGETMAVIVEGIMEHLGYRHPCGIIPSSVSVCTYGWGRGRQAPQLPDLSGS